MGARPQTRSKGIASWPEEERPRERLLSCGPQALTDAELVAILIRVGFKGTSAVELARHLIKRFGSLRAMVQAPVLALLEVKGLKGAKAAQLLAAMEIARRIAVPTKRAQFQIKSTSAAADYLRDRLRGLPEEQFRVLYLNRRSALLDDVLVAQGAVDSVRPPLRTIITRALQANAGLYDFSKLKELPWESWRFFALQLFQCRAEAHKIAGIELDGYLKGASVLVFNHQKKPGVRIDEETIRSIHEALGSKVGSRLFIIAPALTFDFQQDYLDLDKVRYYALRIPYSIIHELHQREFTALKQPSDELAVNDTVEAVGFDFIRTPELEYECGGAKRKGELFTEAFIRIKTFKSEAVVREPVRKKGNRETLSMVMLDYDYEADIFDLDAVFYADAIEKAGWEVRFPVESLGRQVMAVFVDIYGNEARELIPAERFGAQPKARAGNGVKPSRKKGAK